MKKYNEMREEEKVYAIIKNRYVFINTYGVPKGGEKEHYRSNEFLEDFFSRNNIKFDDELNAIMR
jgi:hypothetical protein